MWGFMFPTNDVGEGSGSQSGGIPPTPPTDTPDPPTGLVITQISTTALRLDWVWGADGGSPITGSHIEEESPIGSGTWLVVVPDSGSTNNFYQDNGLNPGTEHNYRVSGINANGTGSPSAPNYGYTAPIPIQAGDVNMRFGFNVAHFYWDYAHYTEFSAISGDMFVNFGTRLLYNWNAYEQANSGAAGNYYEGLASAAQIIAGCENARDYYTSLYDAYKVGHPQTVVGSYLAYYSTMTEAVMGSAPLPYGQIWPTADQLETDYDPSCILAPTPAAPYSTGGIDHFNIALCQDPWLEAIYQIGLGNLSRERQDAVLLDEIGNVAGGLWDNNVASLVPLKTRFNQAGVTLAGNVGGWGFGSPIPGHCPDVLTELPTMLDFMTLEGVWSRDPSVGTFGYRSETQTVAIIDHIRAVLDGGMGFGIVSVPSTSNNNYWDISTSAETDTNTTLTVTLFGPQRIIPGSTATLTGGITFSGVGGAYAPLNGTLWTPTAVGGSPNDVKLTPYGFTLASFHAANPGVPNPITGDFGGLMVDTTCDTYNLAAFSMMIRRPGDKLYVLQGPLATVDCPGGGSSVNPECWWYWPFQLGEPTADYTLTADGSGMVTELSRPFDSGQTMHIYLSSVNCFVRII